MTGHDDRRSQPASGNRVPGLAARQLRIPERTSVRVNRAVPVCGSIIVAAALTCSAMMARAQSASEPASRPAVRSTAIDIFDIHPPAVRFTAIDIYIDSGHEHLAAYQFELKARKAEVEIVGIEGGEHPAFNTPPYYDPAALNNHRVIIAAFNTTSDLPNGRTRVARIHVQIIGGAEPDYEADLQVAASSQGKSIKTASIHVAEGEAR